MASIPKEVLTVRVRKGLKRRLAELAKGERRTVSNLVEILIDRALEPRTETTPKAEAA